MVSFLEVILATAVVVLTYIAYELFSIRLSKLPPRPFALPFVGNSLSLMPEPARNMMALSRKLGPTFSVKFGRKTQVIINSYSTAKVVFNDENTTGRDQTFIITKLLSNKGFLGSEHGVWRHNRRIVLSILRDLGMGKSWLEDAILSEVSQLIDIFRKHADQPYNPRTNLGVSVSNVICAMVFGKRFAHDDTKFCNLLAMLNDNGSLITKVIPIEILPFLKYLPINSKAMYDQLANQVAVIVSSLEQMVKEHRSANANDKVSTNSCETSFIDLYAAEMKENPRPELNEGELAACVLSLFAAGSETTATTLIWAILYLLENPDIQRAVQKEIDQQVARDRPVRTSDRANLPYTDAVLHEVQRLGSVVPLGVPHTNFKTMTIDGFTIPQRTVINLNIYAIHRDPTVWTNLLQFDPKNFLTDEGKLMVPKEFVPFGVGHRMCLGQSLARTELFLFFANIIRTFELKKPEGFNVCSEKPKVSFVRTPPPFEVIFTPRT